MFRKLTGILAFALMALTLLAPSASAAVYFDAASGTGFVGKGDVQLAFGWNNAALQKNAADVSFTFVSTESWEGVCTWTTGEGARGEKVHTVTHTRSSFVNDTIAFDARTRNQITGFNLNGFGSMTSTGEAMPEVGAACPGEQGTGAVFTSVTLVSSTGGLYVNYGDVSVLLPITPAI